MATTPVSPKVHAAGGAGAVSIVVLYALNHWALLATLPFDVKVALSAIIVGIITWTAGYLATDPNRIVLDLERFIQRAAGLAAQSAVTQQATAVQQAAAAQTHTVAKKVAPPAK